MPKFNTDQIYRLVGQGPTGPITMADEDLERLKRRGRICKWYRIRDENDAIIHTKEGPVRNS